ncbi:MAG TPA: methyl-accepting chemotaxis protein [Mobilitalea sp.]|nr:methyl-accepting chemotaxis protein [Mobilitalea sp.]
MKRFSDLKIRTKLIICFITLAFFTGVVGVFGIINTKSMYENSRAMYEKDFMPAQHLKEIQVAYEEIRANHILSVYDTDTSKLQSRLDKIDQSIKQVDQLFNDYEKAIRNEDEQALFDKVKASNLEYGKLRTASLELVKNGDNAQAVAALSNVTASREKATSDLQALVDYNMNLSMEKVQQNKTNYNGLLVWMTIIIITVVVIAIVLGIIVSGIISKPVNQMVKAAHRLALGDVGVSIDITSRDEVGSLANSFKEMIENIRLQAHTAERIADGDLTVDVVIRSENDLLGKKLEQMVHSNNEVLSGIAAAAEQVAVGARQISDSSMALSQGATEQASSVEELTASLQEIASQTELNAQHAGEANELAESAKQNAIKGNSQMKEMLKAMVDINESSANISKVIKVIDDIAFQTNILALNAAVEAARAGQHGKGFAVVAEEVRNLAARSASAAKETTDMIESSIRKAEGGTKIARDTAQALDNIVAGVEKVAELVSNIAIDSNEQAMGITQVNQGIMQVSQVVQTNSATSEEGAAASEELSSQAELLKETVGRFQLKDTHQSIRTHENISPEVLRLLKNMSATSSKPKIHF